jgi:uncharacterized protein
MVFLDSGNNLRNGWKIVLFFCIATGLAVGLVFLRRSFPVAIRRILPEPHLAFLGTLSAAWICLRLERLPLAAMGLSINRRFWAELGLGAIAGVSMLGLAASVVWALDGFHFVRSPGGTVALLLKGGWLMLGVALFEETLFRGYAFQRAIKGIGPMRAQILFAVVFCVMHLPNAGMNGATMVWAMLNIFLASLMLGYCYLRTGSLALPIGVHMGWNWASSSLGLGVSGNGSDGFWTPVIHARPDWLTGGAFGLEASAVSVAVLGLAVLGLARWKAPGAGLVPALARQHP